MGEYMFSKIKMSLVVIVILLVSSSCTNLTLDEEPKENEEIVEEGIDYGSEEFVDNRYDSIENTIISLDKIGERLVGNDGNYNFMNDLKEYLNSNFPEAELFIQPYTISLTAEYKVSISSENNSITFDNFNSICKYINKGKLSESTIVTDTLEGLDSSKNYIFISEDYSLIEKSKSYENICLSLQSVDTIFLEQNVIKVKTDIPTIMNVDNITAEKLLEYKGEAINLLIDIKNKEFELQNIFAVIKGRQSNNAIAITSHIDSTTSLGNNYSKGAIDNGSGISINLDLLRKNYAKKNTSNYDLIFAFVNSEEGFLLKSSSGSMVLNDLLSQKYENTLNVNLDCLGEKNIDILSYGFDGSINKNVIAEIIISQETEELKLEQAEYYTSDNLSFNNSIYFYNFDYHGENRAIHTENDTMKAIEINQLEQLSTIIFNILIEIIKLDYTVLFV